LKNKIRNLKEMLQKIDDHKNEGKKVVFTNGCYDLIHVGHVRFLEQCKRLGDILVVALNSDRSVRSIKGFPRPINPQDERAEIVAALEYVDYITIFDQDDPLELITQLKPDVLVKGGDWTLPTIVGREVVESYGGKVYSIPLIPGASTSKIITFIANSYKNKVTED
jgi:D-beta-D-heptose 7-phosphate kinase/D-beta-D-heptose 1-phosphate adenosyltransferase